MINLEERTKIIDFVEQDDNFFKKIGSESAFVWEKYLVSDYWKNWREGVKSAQSEKDAELLAYKVLKLRSNIFWNLGYYEKKGDVNRYEADIKKLVEKNEKELQNMTEDEFYGNKPKNGFKELSIQEALNDPWFNEQINILFGLENKKFPKEEKTNREDYKSWTKEQLITEINHLKTEIESLKNSQTLTSSERQGRLQYNQQKLDQIQSVFNSKVTQYPTSNIPFTPLFIGGTLLALMALISFLVIRKHRKNK